MQLELEYAIEDARRFITRVEAYRDVIKAGAITEAELATLKARPQEVPPLDKWRVLATAKKIMIDLANEKEDAECVMWLTASDSIAHPIAYTVGSPVPYDVK